MMMMITLMMMMMMMMMMVCQVQSITHETRSPREDNKTLDTSNALPVNNSTMYVTRYNEVVKYLITLLP